MLEPALNSFRGRAMTGPPRCYYDPDVHLVANTIDNGIFHSAWHVRGIRRRFGREAEIRRKRSNAPKPSSQPFSIAKIWTERSPHFGNFRWEHGGSGQSRTLNAVQFVLVRLDTAAAEAFGSLCPIQLSFCKGRGGISATDWTRSAGLMFLAYLLKHRRPRHLQFDLLGGQLIAIVPEYVLERGLPPNFANGWRS